ncbi:MAG: ThiF family adenylyltransferase [Cyclobacteriaceae bacterium]|nr:ThiF family adenylyltransferase [Cyclobacteriaceae bacterium]
MLPQLINHSPDLLQLWDDGLSLEIREGHLLVHDVPYVNSQRAISYGTLVSTLNLAGEKTTTPETHVAHFIGDEPCDKNGHPISSIINGTAKQVLSTGIAIDVTFSSKPKDGYKNYYDKISTYLSIICNPAKALDESVTERKFKVYQTEESDDDTVFQYTDSNTSRAGIGAVSDKLKGHRIAIIGLGGTGAYILDAVAKTPVKEIHLFDEDWFLQHNAFRAPGAASIETLKSRIKKVDYYHEVYSRMHKGIVKHGRVDSSNLTELDQMHFVFIAIDKAGSKGPIMKYLEEKDKAFIDVGMGVHLVEDSLIGIVALTSSVPGKRDHVWNGRVSLGDNGHNDYAKNIQIAELNSLNAALAVLKWKKLIGFYQDLEGELHSNYSINVNMLLSEDQA